MLKESVVQAARNQYRGGYEALDLGTALRRAEEGGAFDD
jgi:hypothetical protein